MTSSTPFRTQAERADQTRARILDAAVRQFSENGLAGARTEQIAEEAGVNKALLYYYFSSKQALYDAALEAVGEGVRATSMAVLEADASAGERFLMSALNHFDRIHTNPGFQSLMQQEMVRLHRGEANALSPLVEKIFRPLMEKTQQVLKEGIASGELIPVDPAQIRYAALGANVLYFLSAPLMRMIQGADPLENGALEFRRTAAIQYLGQTIFVDRERGTQVAARVLSGTPMPAESHIWPRLVPELRASTTNEVRHK
jgi:TetR/AcrR family transcriptional regulator